MIFDSQVLALLHQYWEVPTLLWPGICPPSARSFFFLRTGDTMKIINGESDGGKNELFWLHFLRSTVLTLHSRIRLQWWERSHPIDKLNRTRKSYCARGHYSTAPVFACIRADFIRSSQRTYLQLIGNADPIRQASVDRSFRMEITSPWQNVELRWRQSPMLWYKNTERGSHVAFMKRFYSSRTRVRDELTGREIDEEMDGWCIDRWMDGSIQMDRLI